MENKSRLRPTQRLDLLLDRFARLAYHHPDNKAYLTEGMERKAKRAEWLNRPENAAAKRDVEYASLRLTAVYLSSVFGLSVFAWAVAAMVS